MRIKVWRLVLIPVVVLGGILLFLHFSDPTAPEAPEQAGKEVHEPGPAPGKGTPDPFGRYDPPIELSISRSVDGSLRYPPGQTLDDNVWYEMIADELGIRVTNAWVVNAEQYEQRVNVTIISGQLPDVMRGVQSYQLEQMVAAGMVEDLTDAFEAYASPLLKSLMQKNGGQAFQTAQYDGRIMALPQDAGILDSMSMVWIRRDWLDRLGLEPPQSMEDLLAISRAFTEQDPDNNGLDDTIGLAVTKEFYQSGFFELTPFFNGFHAYPQQWIRTPDGQIVYGSIQPEMREALLQLQRMFADGQLDMEFSVKDSTKVTEMLAANKIGMFFGRNWNAVHPLNSIRAQHPDMVWEAYPIVSVDDRPAMPQISLKPGGYYVVRKGYEHPEALIKLMNHFVAIRSNPTEEQFRTLLNIPQEDGGSIEAFKFAPVEFILPEKNQQIFLEVNHALDTGDTSRLNAEMRGAYEEILQYENGDDRGWPSWIINRKGEGHARSVLTHYIDQELYLPDAFMGNETETMVAKLPTLKLIEVATFMKIVLGDPIENFDWFVEEWKMLGGEEMTREVNEWYRDYQHRR